MTLTSAAWKASQWTHDKAQHLLNVHVSGMGFQGFDVDGIVILQPKKKPRGGRLTDEEKDGNRRIRVLNGYLEKLLNTVSDQY